MPITTVAKQPRLTRQLAIELFRHDVVEEAEKCYRQNGGKDENFWQEVDDREKVVDHFMKTHVHHFGRVHYPIQKAISHLQKACIL
ncbi:MAG: hypothetical protein ABH822_00945 [Patescibacteria group bacterium]